MSFEIVYTSAPRGLREGSRGFCTVAATKGIPGPLLDRLESLSGYQHLFTDSAANPVNYAHLIVRVQSQRYSVLSRVADAGRDHTGRSNKIAHHLALAADEVSGEYGPEQYLAEPEFWFTAWAGEPQLLEPDRFPSVQFGLESTGAWQQWSGDAGWAGVLAERISGGSDPAWIIVPPELDTLALVAEAMRLVPPGERWRVCFSTYFTRLPTGSRCQWRFVIDGTDAAARLRSRPTGLVIDPERSGDAVAFSSPLVEAARGGPVDEELESDLLPSDEPVVTGPAARTGSGQRRPMTPSQLRRRQAGARARQARLARGQRPVVRRQPEIEVDVESILPELPEPRKLTKRMIVALVLSATAVAAAVGWAVMVGMS